MGRPRKKAAEEADIGWDDYFLGVAKAIKRKSKDATKVGAVVVSADKLIVSTGYNGFARGVEDPIEILLDKRHRDEKLRLICHAEFNAVMNAARSGISLKNCTIYTNKFPCLACSNAIIQSGIIRICTDDKSYWPHDPLDQKEAYYPHKNWRTRILLQQAGVKVEAPNHPDFCLAKRKKRLRCGKNTKRNRSTRGKPQGPVAT